MRFNHGLCLEEYFGDEKRNDIRLYPNAYEDLRSNQMLVINGILISPLIVRVLPVIEVSMW